MSRSLLAGLLDLVFPPHCVACGERGSWLCPACLARVQRLAHPLCPRCGEPAADAARCPRRRQHPRQLDGLRSAAWHAGPLRAAIHHFKYRGLHVLAQPLAGILIDAWREEAPPAALLIPVPLHPQRVRERGYNQAALLAEHMGRALALPVDSASLARIRPTPPQVGLTASQRRANVEDAFLCRGRSLSGRAVCLIDDLYTTGATLDACAAALRSAGAQSVWAYTLARPPWQAAFAPRRRPPPEQEGTTSSS